VWFDKGLMGKPHGLDAVRFDIRLVRDFVLRSAVGMFDLAGFAGEE
jgi:hypothetical protein